MRIDDISSSKIEADCRSGDANVEPSSACGHDVNRRQAGEPCG